MLDFLIKVFQRAFFSEFILLFFTIIQHLFPYYFMKHHLSLTTQKFKTLLHTRVFLDF